MKINVTKLSKTITTILPILLVVTVFLTGCEPLKKKFVRQKKRDQNAEANFIPVLDPVDYPETRETAHSKYRHHYLLWNVWQRDLVIYLEELPGERVTKNMKRAQFLVDQAISQMQEMEKYISDQKKPEMAGFIKTFREVRSSLEQPNSVRNDTVILHKIRRVAKDFKKGFKVSNVQDEISY